MEELFNTWIVNSGVRASWDISFIVSFSIWASPLAFRHCQGCINMRKMNSRLYDDFLRSTKQENWRSGQNGNRNIFTVGLGLISSYRINVCDSAAKTEDLCRLVQKPNKSDYQDRWSKDEMGTTKGISWFVKISYGSIFTQSVIVAASEEWN